MKLLKSFSIYTFIGFLAAGVGLFIMPVLTHYLSPEDYGTIALFNTYTELLVPLVGFVASGYISVEYFNQSHSKAEFSSIYSSILAIPIIPTVVLVSAGFLFRSLLSPIIEIPTAYIALIPVLAILTYYYQHILNFLAIKKKPVVYGISNISKVIFEVTLTLVLIIAFHMNWKGRIDSWIITMILFLIFGWIYSKNRQLLTLNLKKKYIRAGIAFGLPLILHSIGKIVVNQSDRIFISKMVSVNEMGIYNTGYLIGSILMIISAAFINVYNPYLYERLAEINEKKKIEILRISYLFLITLILLLVIISSLAPYFYRFFINESYQGGAKYVFWIGLSYLFWGGYLIFAGYIFYFKKTKVLAYLAIINVVFNLYFNYIFIKAYGAIGAAYATALSFFIIFVLVALISSKIYPMPWLNFKKILKAE